MMKHGTTHLAKVRNRNASNHLWPKCCAEFGEGMFKCAKCVEASFRHVEEVLRLAFWFPVSHPFPSISQDISEDGICSCQIGAAGQFGVILRPNGPE